MGSTCFGHYYAHHQDLVTMMLITTLVVLFCKDGGVSVNVNLWFLLVLQNETTNVVIDNIVTCS